MLLLFFWSSRKHPKGVPSTCASDRKTDLGVLLALAQHRRQRGRIHFGVLMGIESGEGQMLHEGCELQIVRVSGSGESDG